MKKRPLIWIMDTSVFTNVLNIPVRNQNRDVILELFRERIESDDTFLLPYAQKI